MQTANSIVHPQPALPVLQATSFQATNVNKSAQYKIVIFVLPQPPAIPVSVVTTLQMAQNALLSAVLGRSTTELLLTLSAKYVVLLSQTATLASSFHHKYTAKSASLATSSTGPNSVLSAARRKLTVKVVHPPQFAPLACQDSVF